MNYLIFRGVSTQDIGVHMVKMPPHAKPSVRYTAYQVDGRDDELHKIHGYAPFDLTCQLTMIKDDAYTRDMINAWADGSGLLVTSDMPDRAWQASVLGDVKYERRMYDYRFYDLARITFRCQPGMREAVPSMITFEQSGSIINPGSMIARPKMVIYGSGECVFSVGGNTITLHNVNDAVTLDCEAGYAYTPSGAAQMVGDFPVIPLGQSDVVLGTGTSKIEIQPNWRWL